MSTQTGAVTNCPPLQMALNDAFLVCDEPAELRKISILPFLMSPANTTGLVKAVSMAPGKKNEVIVVYEQEIPTSAVGTKSGCDKLCTATTEDGDLSTQYSIDCGGTQIERLIDPVLWIDSCTDPAGFAMRELARMIQASDLKNSINVVTDVGAFIGKYASDVPGLTGNSLVINTLNSGTVNFNPGAFYDVRNALDLTNCRPSLIASGQTFVKYARMMEAGCCNDGGMDLAEVMRLYGMAVDYDIHLQQIHGADYAIAIQQGAVQVLTLNHNNGALAQMDWFNVGPGAGTYAEFILKSPWTGVPYDVTVKYDCGKVHLIVESNIQAVQMPLGMFPVGSNTEGVTFVNAIDVSNT